MRVIGPANLDVSAMVDRMRQTIGVKKDADLSQALGVSVSAPSNWRQRNSPPLAFAANVAAAFGVSLDWLVFGRKGSASVEAAQGSTVPVAATSAAAQRLTRFVNEWDASRSEDESIWLEQHMKRMVPEYAEWLANQVK